VASSVRLGIDSSRRSRPTAGSSSAPSYGSITSAAQSSQYERHADLYHALLLFYGSHNPLSHSHTPILSVALSYRASRT
jgi:hypothetical protein